MKYATPEMEIVAFETDDVITTSSATTPSYNNPDDSIGGELG